VLPLVRRLLELPAH